MWDFLELELWAAMSHQMWVMGTEFGPLKEQKVFLTAETSISLAPTALNFKVMQSLHLWRVS